MKKYLVILIALFLSLQVFALPPDNDTIKIMAGDKQILIISNDKQDQMENLEYGLDKFQDKINEFMKKIDSLQQIIDSAQSCLDTANDTVKIDLQHSIQMWKEQIQDYQKFIAALQKGIEDIKAQIDELNKEIASDTDTTQKPKHEKFTFKPFSKKKTFKGHWNGLEIGVNSFIYDNQLINNTDNILAPNLSNSFEVNFNCFKSSLQITHFFGFVTGFGVKINNYKYEDFPYYSTETSMLYLDSLHSQYDQQGKLTKVKMKTIALRIPLLTEIQFDHKGKTYISFGGYVGLQTTAKVKYVYDINNKRSITKQNIISLTNPIIYGLTARIGLKGIQLYCDYTMVPLFKNTENPQIYPISLGIRASL